MTTYEIHQIKNHLLNYLLCADKAHLHAINKMCDVAEQQELQSGLTSYEKNELDNGSKIMAIKSIKNRLGLPLPQAIAVAKKYKPW